MTDQEYNKVKEYALEKYPRMFKDAKQIFVMENDSVYFQGCLRMLNRYL